MDYSFIYSAGGGAGDWNGIKRIWNESMPISLKENILLKFGDVFFNHASSANLTKSRLWTNVTNLREWLHLGVNDDYVLNTSGITLDNGTSKIVNWVNTQHNEYSNREIIEYADSVINEKEILEKYAEIIIESDINYAVTFDLPNPFKIRTQSANTATNIFSAPDNDLLIEVTSSYCNRIYELLGSTQDRLLTIINGSWNSEELERFFENLIYTPDKLAIGGLTRSNNTLGEKLQNIDDVITLNNLERIHILGCGGIRNVDIIKDTVESTDMICVDNSTPYNRAIDGNTKNTAFSGYFDYTTKNLIRIKNVQSRDNILSMHSEFEDVHFSVAEMRRILNLILGHQAGNSGQNTYNARASLIIHNHHVFQHNVLE